MWFLRLASRERDTVYRQTHGNTGSRLIKTTILWCNLPFSDTELTSAPRFISSDIIATFPVNAAQSRADLLSSVLLTLISDAMESWNGSVSVSKHCMNLSTFPFMAHSIAILTLATELSVLMLVTLGGFSASDKLHLFLSCSKSK